MNEPYRLRYANQIVGAFLLVVLLIGLVLTVLLLRSGDYFAKQNRYWFEIDQSQLDGLRRGIEVTMLGQRVGEVQSVQYVDATSRVRINLAIDAKQSDQIFESSILVPDRKFGVGTPMLSIRRGPMATANAVPLAPGSPITIARDDTDSVDQVTREVKSVSGSVEKIQQKLDPTLSTVDKTATEFSETITGRMNPAFDRVKTASEEFRQTNVAIRPDAIATLEAIRTATADLQQRVGTLTAEIQNLVNRDVRQTLQNVQQSTDQVSAAAKQVSRTAEDSNEEIASALLTVQKAAESVQQLAEETRQVVRIVRREADDLPGTTARINDTTSETQDLVEEIRGHWLLRGTSRRGQPTAPVPPSTIRSGMGR